MAAAEAVVRREDHQGILGHMQRIQLVQDPADGGIHGRHGGEIADQIAALILGHLIRQIDAVRIPGQMGHGCKGAVLIEVRIFLGMVVQPWGMGRGIAHVQQEGLLLPGPAVQVFQGIVRNGIRHIALLPVELPVLIHGRAIVGTAAALVAEPVGKALLGLFRGAHVPFAGQSAVVSGLGKSLGIGILARQILNGGLPVVVVPQPVVDAVLAGDAAGQKACSGRRAHGRCAEKVIKAHSLRRQAVNIRCNDLPVAGAAQGPPALIIRQKEYDIWVFHAHSLLLKNSQYHIFFEK